MVKKLHFIYVSEFNKYVYNGDSKPLNGPTILELSKGDQPIPFISRIPQNFHKKLCEKVKKIARDLNKWISLGLRR
jgi:hypothetical protein